MLSGLRCDGSSPAGSVLRRADCGRARPDSLEAQRLRWAEPPQQLDLAPAGLPYQQHGAPVRLPRWPRGFVRVQQRRGPGEGASRDVRCIIASVRSPVSWLGAGPLASSTRRGATSVPPNRRELCLAWCSSPSSTRHPWLENTSTERKGRPRIPGDAPTFSRKCRPRSLCVWVGALSAVKTD